MTPEHLRPGGMQNSTLTAREKLAVESKVVNTERKSVWPVMQLGYTFRRCRRSGSNTFARRSVKRIIFITGCAEFRIHRQMAEDLYFMY